MRKAGILLPVFSLPNRFGIGCFSQEAYDFIDFLHDSKQSYWQVLPLGPTGEASSPYDPMSSFAGNPIYIDIDTLVRKGHLKHSDIPKDIPCNSYDTFGRYIRNSEVKDLKLQLLRKAYSNFTADNSFSQFIDENSYWIEDTALFYALSRHFGSTDWHNWPQDIRYRRISAIIYYSAKLIEDYNFFRWTQYEFFSEWNDILSYAHSRNIDIVGDMPIYTSYQGADCWSHPEIFQLNADLKYTDVSGCPPDAFSSIGQKWNNPLYNWHNRKDTFTWWGERIRQNFRMFDVLRIDHFRGLESYYSIPAGDDTALNGHWEKGPGMSLFNYLATTIGNHRYFAEDLGYITPEVRHLLDETGFPGMKVLQFAFDSDLHNPYLPHNYTENCVVYTGTHDNSTLRGWFNEQNEYRIKFIHDYLDDHRDVLNGTLDVSSVNEDNICDIMIYMAQLSIADTCIIPIQDYLELDRRARNNVPSIAEGNWNWQLRDDYMTHELSERIKKITVMAERA